MIDHRRVATPEVEALLERFRRRERRALARAITLVESRAQGAHEILAELYPDTGRAHVIGVTGAPGVGKSTLVDRLAGVYRDRGREVGVIAVDPTSPFSGGAILGDRIRMERGQLDPGIFIRSLATRGHLGGLSLATGDVIALMDAFGFDVILVETVGAGQSEVDIMRYADTTVVVLAPGLGDDVQAIKAGILEIGDVFAVNKADREGADRTVRELEVMLDLAPEHGPWRPPVVKTVAGSPVHRPGQAAPGVAELAEHVDAHLAQLRDSGRLLARRRAEALDRLREAVALRVEAVLTGGAKSDFERLAEEVATRQTDPYGAAEEIIQRHLPCLAARPQGGPRPAPESDSEGPA